MGPRREGRGQLYPVDIAGGKPEIFQVAAEAYYAKLLQQASSSPNFFSMPGGEKVKLDASCVRFLPVYRDDTSCKILVLTNPQDKETVLAVYLNQSWWPVEEIVKTADPAREGLIPVQTFGERIVLFVLNYIVFGMLERSSANDAFFVPHSATECAKILWSNGDAVAFYTFKIKGSLCNNNTSQCYFLPVLDTIFVRRKNRGCGLGMTMLKDFCQSFGTEDALGISCPISGAMYQGKTPDVETLVCRRFLQAHSEEQERLWEVEAPGDWSQRVNIWLKIRLGPGLPESHHHSSEDKGGCPIAQTHDDEPKRSDAGQMNKGEERVPDGGEVAQDGKENADDTATEARPLDLQATREEDFSSGVPDAQQCKGSRKRVSTGDSVVDKAAKHLIVIP
ncbi:PREDICTED: protein FAM169B isoform X1 [Crocodylus porosus]|uniref:protein FAM169B isoform X1 n=1 Tax=Crocodylus porosus TaxID=8502 RepID=UPI00093D1AB7|nr:PREDICTED: protein FAM169B isoform X1 [Crocodylus porosus]